MLTLIGCNYACRGNCMSARLRRARIALVGIGRFTSGVNPSARRAPSTDLEVPRWLIRAFGSEKTRLKLKLFS